MQRYKEAAEEEDLYCLIKSPPSLRWCLLNNMACVCIVLLVLRQHTIFDLQGKG